MSNLAHIYRAAGQLWEARSLAEHILEKSLNDLGHAHPFTITTMINLAYTYHYLGCASNSFVLHEKALRFSKVYLGHDDTLTLLAKRHFNIRRRELGQGCDTVECMQGIWKYYRLKRGNEAPGTLEVLSELAICYENVDSLANAMQIYHDATGISERCLAPDHPITFFAKSHLARAYAQSGDLSQAIKIQELIVHHQRQFLGPLHEESLIFMNTLAVYYMRLGETKKAKSLHLAVRDSACMTLGSNHPSTLIFQMNLAHAYSILEMWGKARDILLASESISYHTLGDNHPISLII